jgi:opacity protein-like surface antigen
MCLSLSAQERNRENSFGLDMRYTSGSQLFPEPYSPDPVKRNTTEDLGDFLTAAVHYRRHITEAVEVQLTGEYIDHDNETTDNYGTVTSDGYRMYSAELLGLFRMPFSTRKVGFYAGGGGGFVYGERRLSVAGVQATSLESDLAFGIHVLFGIEYFLSETISFRGEFHFRDPQIAVKNVFPQDRVVSHGITYYLPTEPFYSKINLNGNVYSFGASWHW